MMVGMLAMTAFAVDIGYIQVVRSQMQTSADAAALAAAWGLIDEGTLTGNGDSAATMQKARDSAAQFAALNLVGRQAPQLATADVTIGYAADSSNPNIVTFEEDSSINPANYNAVRVRIRRTDAQNGALPLFFARIFGLDNSSQQAEATAMFLNDTNGFTMPDNGENLDLLPFALDMGTWTAMMNRTVHDDDWARDPDTGQIFAGSDGILEVNLFPQETGAPGNRGTVDMGSNNNSTADLARQITHGVSAADLAYHGGSLEFNVDGLMFLNGDTGISAGVKDELTAIIGQPRTILLFTAVNGNGNNATYTIAGFAGVRIVEVKLTGKLSDKRVTVQPSHVTAQGMIRPIGNSKKSHFVHSNVWLVR